jgi:hypothetical protein
MESLCNLDMTRSSSQHSPALTPVQLFQEPTRYCGQYVFCNNSLFSVGRRIGIDVTMEIDQSCLIRATTLREETLRAYSSTTAEFQTYLESFGFLGDFGSISPFPTARHLDWDGSQCLHHR